MVAAFVNGTTAFVNGASSLDVEVQEEGTVVALRRRVNFIGAGVTATDDPTGDRANVTVTAGGGGEANTASNVGTAGVGVFKTKTGVDLELKKINAGSSKITITDDVANDEVDIDLGPHASDHNSGGGDEISIAGLSGEAADAQKTSVEDDGVAIGTRPTLNFTGAGVTVTDDVGNNEIDIDIPLGPHTHVEADITDLDHTDTDAIHDNVAAEISVVAEKTSPLEDDLVLIEDSAAANVKKRLKLGNLPRAFRISVGRNNATTTDIWLRDANGIPTNVAPIRLPFACRLVSIAATGNVAQTWDAEVYSGAIVRTGGVPSDASKDTELAMSASLSDDITVNIAYSAGTEIGIFLRGTSIDFPRVDLYLVRTG